MTEHALTGPRGVRAGVLLAAALAIVATAHSMAVPGPFLWDDRPLIEHEAAIHEIRLVDYFAQPFWRATPEDQANPVYYRPVTSLTYAVDWQVWGGSPAGFHLTNILLHLGVCAALFALARRAGASAASAAAAACLFGLFPRLTECVSWISGRTDVLAALFALCAILLHTAPGARTPLRSAAAVLLFLGFLSKEVALAAVAALAVYEWRAAAVSGTSPLARWPRLMPVAFATVAYFALRWSALRSLPASAGHRDYPSGLSRVVPIVESLGWYVLMLLDPLRPRTQIGLLSDPSPVAVTVGAVTAIALVAAAAWCWRRRRVPVALAAAALTLSCGALFLVLHFVPLSVDVVAADRFLYVPVAGLAIAAAARWPHLAEGRGALVALALVAAFGVATSARALEWTDEVRFWSEATAQTHPMNVLPANELGTALRRAGRYEEALAHLDRAAARSRGKARLSAAANAAITLAEMGRLDEAARRLRDLIALGGASALEHFNLAVVEAKRLRFEAARAELREAERLFPGYEDARRAASIIEEAERQWLQLPAESPSEPIRLRARRAEIFGRLGADPRAAALWREVIAAPDADAEDLDRAAAFLILRGSHDDARDALHRARAAGARSLQQLEQAFSHRFPAAGPGAAP